MRNADNSRFNTDFIPPRIKKYIYDSNKIVIKSNEHSFKKLNLNKYEFYIYNRLKQYIDSGDIYIKDSINYRSLEDELVSVDVMENEENIIKMMRIKRLDKPIDDILTDFKKQLERKYRTVNHRLKQGKNQFLKILQKR